MSFALFLKDFFKDNFSNRDTISPTNKPRIEFIDLAKGICILLVVINHFGFWTEIHALKAIRMPLYFILSGLFYKDYGGLINLTIKKLNKILIPFLFFFGIGLIFLTKLNPSAIYQEFVRPFHTPLIVNYPIWFLICLLR